jgi:prophage regulatory protein
MSKLLDYADLRERGIKYSRPHLWRMWNNGLFPRPVKVSPQRNAWLETDIDSWIENLVNERADVEAV